ncbi:hypothetical protein BH09BAC3_BH09BAC3_31260 [soil metagenome]
MASLEQLKMLINLARVDGMVADKERQFIINIGQANHLLVAEILPLFSNSNTAVIPSNLTNEQKFDYILTLIKLMKIDEKIYRDEIVFCSKVASALGYRQEVLFELMLKVKNTEMEADELEALKKLTATYLLHG